eukprot:Opistho-2@2839
MSFISFMTRRSSVRMDSGGNDLSGSGWSQLANAVSSLPSLISVSWRSVFRISVSTSSSIMIFLTPGFFSLLASRSSTAAWFILSTKSFTASRTVLSITSFRPRERRDLICPSILSKAETSLDTFASSSSTLPSLLSAAPPEDARGALGTVLAPAFLGIFLRPPDADADPDEGAWNPGASSMSLSPKPPNVSPSSSSSSPKKDFISTFRSCASVLASFSADAESPAVASDGAPATPDELTMPVASSSSFARMSLLSLLSLSSFTRMSLLSLLSTPDTPSPTPTSAATVAPSASSECSCTPDTSAVVGVAASSRLVASVATRFATCPTPSSPPGCASSSSLSRRRLRASSALISASVDSNSAEV